MEVLTAVLGCSAAVVAAAAEHSKLRFEATMLVARQVGLLLDWRGGWIACMGAKRGEVAGKCYAVPLN